MGETVEELLETIERALSLMKGRGEARLSGDIENLLRIKRVLESLDPAEVDALLEEDDEED